jgi:putative NIF3 family GTP cyclohydrolase 1 type 2
MHAAVLLDQVLNGRRAAAAAFLDLVLTHHGVLYMQDNESCTHTTYN